MRRPRSRRYTPIPVNGATVAITGGARGIGRATAERFAARGARVAIGDIEFDRACEAAAAIGGGVTAHELDVSSRDSFAGFLASAEAAHGALDVLVNNAGIMPAGSFLDESDESIDRQLAVNVIGVVNGMRVALPAMCERRRGHVVNVASMAGKLQIPGLAVYCGGKHAVVAMSGVVRREVADFGVSVSAVLPTAVKTELVAGIPLGRGLPAVEPEQVAEAIVASVENRRREIAVPRGLRPLGALADLTPEPLMRTLLRLINGDRAISGVDREARADYARRAGGDAR